LTTSLTAPEFGASALVVIDTQEDVLDGGGFPIAGTSQALPNLRVLLEAFRSAERPIVHVVRIYEADGSNAELCRRQLLASGAAIVVRDTPGSQIPGQLLPDAATPLDAELLLGGGLQSLSAHEVVMFKPRWGAFYATPLEEHLRAHQISTVVFAGCNFPNCPRTSIYEASERDFRVVVARDALSGLYERGQQELEGIGVQLMSAEAVADAVASTRPRLAAP